MNKNRNQSMFNSFFWLMSADLVGRLMTFIVSSLVFRNYGGLALAQLLLVHGILSIGIQFIENSFNNPALRAVKGQVNQREIASEVMNIKNFLGSMFIMALCAVYIANQAIFTPAFLLLALFVPITTQNAQFILQSEKKFNVIAWIRVATALATLLVAVILMEIIEIAEWYYVSVSYVVGALTSTALTNSFSGFKVNSLLSLPKFPKKFTFVKYQKAWQYGFAYVAIQLFTLSTLIFLPNSSPVNLVTASGLSMRIWFLLTIPSTILATIILSQIIGSDQNKKYFVNLLVVSIFLGVFSYSLSLFFVDDILGLFFGESSLQYVSYLRDFSLAVIPFYISNFCTIFLIVYQKQAAVFSIYGIVALFVYVYINQEPFVSVDFISNSWLVANIILTFSLASVGIFEFTLSKIRSSRRVVVGAAGWGNFGDDLIAINIIKKLQSEGNSAITLIGGPLGISKNLEDFGLNVQFVPCSNRFLVAWSIFFSGHVTIGGGGIIVFPNQIYRHYCRVAKFSALSGVPYSLVGVGVQLQGTHKNETARLRRFFEKSISVSVRDTYSRLQIEKFSPHVTVEEIDDPALWFKRMHLVPKEYDLVINVRPLDFDLDFNQKQADEVLNTLGQLLNSLSGSYGKIALLSMSENPLESDSSLLSNLKDRLIVDADLYVYESISQVLDVLARSRVCISMRLHGILASKLLDVPSLGIAYDRKVHDQGQRLGISTLEFDVENLDKGIREWLQDQDFSQRS